MTDNIDISKAMSRIQSNQLLNDDTLHSLQKVSEEIQQTIDVVDFYKRKVEQLRPPIINGEPWYKFSFGKASVTEVNAVMESFSKFVQETFKMVATSQNFQNENDMNICRLVGLLAMAEANSYERLNNIASDIKDMSKEDEESARQLKELEKSFLQSLDDSAMDCEKKEQQMMRLIDYIMKFAENKSKRILSISLNLSEIKDKLDRYCATQDNWVTEAKDAISSWQKDVNNSLEEVMSQTRNVMENIVEDKLCQLDDNFNKMTKRFTEYIAEQEKKINQEQTVIKSLEKDVEDRIEDYDSIIKNQTAAILSQNKQIEKQNEMIRTLRKKVNITLFVGVIAFMLMIGGMMFTFIR